MVYNLSEMKLLARGGQADIYEIDGSQVLRVLRDADAEHAAMLQNERAIMAELKERGADVPEVFEYGEADGQPALAIERVSGPSLMELMLRNPLDLGGSARELARLHREVVSAPAPDALMDIRKRVNFLIGRSSLIDDADKAFVRELLAVLPDGTALQHGDFHPGNILTQGGRRYIIDWFSASRGAPLSDIAHTYLLCANKPRIPGEGRLKFALLKAYAVLFGRRYLKEIGKAVPIDRDEFGRWLAVRAAERTVYGQPSELPGRAAFVKACRMAWENGVPPRRWYKLL